MVATRRSGPVSDLSAGKSPSEPNEESTEGQEEPRKLRGRRLSTGIVESGKRSASPAEQPEVTSLKRQKTEDPEPAEKPAEGSEALEPKEGEEGTNAPLPAEDAKPSSPLLEVKDEVLEEAPSAQEKPEEERVDMLSAEESPQPLSRSPAAAAKSDGQMDDIRLQMHLLRARRDAEAMGKAMMGPSASFSELKWGDLISQYPEHPHAVVSGFCFTIGRSKTCHLRLPDPDVSGMLARLILKGNFVYFENVGGTGTVTLNGRDAKRGDKALLKSGDELAFTGSKHFAYIFQQRTVSLPSASRLAGPSSILVSAEGREPFLMNFPGGAPRPATSYGDLLDKLSKIRNPKEDANPKPPLPGRPPAPVVFDTVSRLRKLEEQGDELRQSLDQANSLRESVRLSIEGLQKGKEREGDAMDMEREGGHTPREGVHTSKETGARKSVNGLARDRSFEALLQAAGEASKGREVGAGEGDGNGGSEEVGKTVPPSSVKVEPEGGPSEGPVQGAGMEQLFQNRAEARDSGENAEQCGSLQEARMLQALREAQDPPNPDKDDPADAAKAKAAEAAAAAKRAAVKESFAKALIDPSETSVSFADFPYYLSETTKQLLIGSAFVHLKRSEYAKYTSELVALSPRMLLAGGPGTDIYQETLVRALAVHFGAKLMVMQAAGAEEEPPVSEQEEAPANGLPSVPCEDEGAAGTPECPVSEEPPVLDGGGQQQGGDNEQDVRMAVSREVEETNQASLQSQTRVDAQQDALDQGAKTTEGPSEMDIALESCQAEAEQAKDSPRAMDAEPREAKAGLGSSEAEPREAGGVPSRLEEVPGRSKAAPGSSAELPGDSVPKVGDASLALEESRVPPIGELPRDSESVPRDSEAGVGDLEKLPGESGVPGRPDTVACEATPGEKDDESVPALLDEKDVEVKEEADEFWGRAVTKLEHLERSISGLLASSRPAEAPEEGKGEKGARGKEGKKAQFFKRGDRVRFCGGPGAGGVSSSLHTYLCGLAAEKQLKSDPPIRGPCVGCRGTVELVYSPSHKVGVRFDKAVPGGSNLGNRCEDGHGFWCNGSNLEQLETLEGVDIEGMRMDVLFEVLSEESTRGPVILHIKDAERSIMGNLDKYLTLRKKLENLQGPIVAIASYTMPDVGKEKAHGGGSALHKFSGQQTSLLELSFFNTLTRLEERGKEPPKISKVLEKLFPSKIKIQPPQKDAQLHEWKKQIEKDVATLKAEANRTTLRKVLKDSDVGCEGLADLEVKDQVLTPDQAQKVVGWGASHYLMAAEEPVVKKGRLQLSVESLRSGVELLRSIREDGSPLRKSLKDIVVEDDFEKRLLSEVIPAEEIGVGFDDIGALESVKETLKELVMLPLQRPELFSRGQLTRPCKGILLFGPPGTGKTMLAKAVATEAGANFINISMATIASKWFGEGEKYVKAVFTLASKLAPSIVFIDEVDSMLGRREKPGEHEAMRKIKNEFMANWDGLKTKDRERVLVLAATNRPFDLDEAVVRRMPRRLMVSLPDAENRRKILQVILGKEELSDSFDFSELSQLTDGYSGSDLKNLCVTAAYQPIREILEREKKEREKAKAEGRPWVAPSSDSPPQIRPLSMNDMRLAKEQVCASVSADAASTAELEQWNEQYGEGGSRQKTQLTYFM